MLSGRLVDVAGAGRAAGGGDTSGNTEQPTGRVRETHARSRAPADGEQQLGSRRTRLGGNTFRWNPGLVRPVSTPRKSRQKAVARQTQAVGGVGDVAPSDQVPSCKVFGKWTGR